jgi:hypothetical protein
MVSTIAGRWKQCFRTVKAKRRFSSDRGGILAEESPIKLERAALDAEEITVLGRSAMSRSRVFLGLEA